jgi:predicted Zn-dependent peptidase
VFDVLSDMYRHPRFDPDDIRRERGVIIEEIMMYRDRPQSRVEDLLAELMWPNHPLGRALIGTPESVRRIGRRDILQFKNKKYVPGNTVVVFAGKVDHDRCVEWVEERMGDLAAKSPPPYRPVSGRVRQRAAAIQTRDIEQAHLAMGVRLFGRYDRRRYALKMLSVILGENMSSRLFQRVREQHGLAYAVHSSVQLFKETGLLEIQAGLDRSRTARALDLIVRELARLREQPVSAQELRRANDYAKGQLLISLENSISQMMWVGENLMGYGRFIQPARVIEELERVGARDIQAVAREVLRVGKISTALIVPTQDTLAPDTVARILGRLG